MNSEQDREAEIVARIKREWLDREISRGMLEIPKSAILGWPGNMFGAVPGPRPSGLPQRGDFACVVRAGTSECEPGECEASFWWFRLSECGAVSASTGSTRFVRILDGVKSGDDDGVVLLDPAVLSAVLGAQ